LISRNAKLTQINQSVFDIRVIATELNEFYNKYGEDCHVKISRKESKGTDKQNRAMHSLLTEYYKSNYHSAPDGYTLEKFKAFMKCSYGPGYINIYHNGKEVTILKSWSDYTKSERANFIDGLISELKQSGASEISKIAEILNGMKLEK